jgi:hypothetical protein
MGAPLGETFQPYYQLSTLFRSWFQVKPATLLIPIDLFLFLLVEEFYGTRYQSGSFSLTNTGNVLFTACVILSFLLTLGLHETDFTLIL